MNTHDAAPSRVEPSSRCEREPSGRMQAARSLRVIDFFCGIGGCAAALHGRANTVLAVDQNRWALATYARNFSHPVVCKTVESLSPDLLSQLRADLWWCSPPCQPFTIKGLQRDLDDCRTQGLRALISHLQAVKPTYFALENVVGFRHSKTHMLLRDVLRETGYPHRRELEVCPSQWGIPNRRLRFYLLAGRSPLVRAPDPPRFQQPLAHFLDPTNQTDLRLDPHVAARFKRAIHVVDPSDPSVVTRCFTKAYGCSTVRSGSYLAHAQEPIRLFSPTEILRLLGFPDGFAFPDDISRLQQFRLLGNSLSIPVVRWVLSHIPRADPAAPRDGHSSLFQPTHDK